MAPQHLAGQLVPSKVDRLGDERPDQGGLQAPDKGLRALLEQYAGGTVQPPSTLLHAAASLAGMKCKRPPVSQLSAARVTLQWLLAGRLLVLLRAVIYTATHLGFNNVKLMPLCMRLALHTPSCA